MSQTVAAPIPYHKDGKWGKQILALQREDGSFGNFHTLSADSGSPLTTEQALRRLLALGFSVQDEPINRTLRYLSECLAGGRTIPDRREKGHSWDIFVELMLSAWVCLLTEQNEHANRIAQKWTKIITGAYASGTYSQQDYLAAYTRVYGEPPRGDRLCDYATFYQVSLLAGGLDARTEQWMLDDILCRPTGIYYLWRRPLCEPPPFDSRQASTYLGAIELLARYPTAPAALGFAADWLERNRGKDGLWDMGPQAKDGVYFPLRDSWRTPQARRADCTERVLRLLHRLRPQA